MSKLQRWTLRAALDRKVNERRGLLYAEIKSNFFGLARAHGEEDDDTGWVFAKGRLRTRQGRRYNVVSSVVSRSTRRLKWRQLIEVGHERIEGHDYQDAQISLTPEGYAVAAGIELRTPGAFGFAPIKKSQLLAIVEKNAQSHLAPRYIIDEFARWTREGETLARLVDVFEVDRVKIKRRRISS